MRVAGFNPATTFAIGRGDRTWGWGWMLRRCCVLAESKTSAKSAEFCVLRSTTTDELKAYLAGSETPEMAWLSPTRQHEEAWFLGLRLNEGVNVAAVREEFGSVPVTRALATVGRLVDAGLLSSEGGTVRLTARGQMLSNDVFQEFLEDAVPAGSSEEFVAIP